jgi:N-dimethylarginine dimethylaminohydrolase
MSILLGNPYIDKTCSKKTITSSFVKKRILNDLKKILEHLGINVIQIDNNVLCDVLWMRDPFFKIDNKIFLSNLNKDRRHETDLVVKYLNKYIVFPQNIKIEGGDIIQDKNNIFIGINERTNIAAYNYLKKMFPKKNVIKINHTATHLDCCFTVLNKNIFYSKTYINSLPNNLKNDYIITTIEDILGDTDPNIALNLLIIDKNIITTNTPEFEPMRIKLMDMGYNVLTIKFNNLLEEGGGIRCLTQWL